MEWAVCVTDGTEIRIPRPAKPADASRHYSPKKKQFSLNVLFIVDLQGRILYVSKPAPFRNDQGHWNHLQLRKLFVDKSYGIIGDGGFYFNPQNQPQKIKGKEPIRNTKTKKLTPTQRRANLQFSQRRVVVENTIGQCKKYRIIADKFRHYSTTGRNTFPIDKIVRVVALLTQRRLLNKPLRHEDWTPARNKIPKKYEEFISWSDNESVEEPAPKPRKGKKK